ncbi:TetR/AcrR family transcriptional regulator C-terminal ligand-binding domain-containing protein [Streptomyces pactum]|uniref:TetR/AcrR family transcriptional regulator C-terminal ligand-binding domain-containing protein n=1 Tax=Streptomyces pactum TaxID=68249 RepID=A0ABS0NIM5_9ACTN|nr:TetR-like C-terminal domain-containing protein [Streptomyces pactum]MBH5334967.1 TetR/AcrR family transcriptional regulator C-terminal ligand-binding domain-containing protein [Streptomyces pactum]
MGKAGTRETSGGGAGRGPDPRAERSRAAALAAASDLLIENGWAGVTHVSVAARSGVGRTTLYRHWPESAMLIQQLLAELFQVEPVVRTGELRADLVGELRAFLGMLHNPKAERALRVIIDQAPLDPRYAEVLASCSRKGTDGLRGIVDEAKERGELPPDLDTDVAIDQLLGPLVFRRLLSGAEFPDDYVPELVDSFLEARVPRS